MVIQSLIVQSLVFVLLFYLILYAMVDTLLQLVQPVHPNTAVQPRDGLFHLSVNLANSRILIELQLIRNVVLAIVASEVELDQEQALGWCEGHVYLIAEESVVDEGGRIVVGQYHYDASDHLPNLVVDEALAGDVEHQVVLVDGSHLEIQDVSLSLGILCSQVLGVVVEIVSSFEDVAAFAHFLEHPILLLSSQINFN